jgi:hypothetical protein
MKKKRALELGFKCPSCQGIIEKIEGTEYGCINAECYNVYHNVKLRVQMGLTPKSRL